MRQSPNFMIDFCINDIKVKYITIYCTVYVMLTCLFTT
jgi:hypothetical protein